MESFKIIEEQEDFIEAFEQIEKSITNYMAELEKTSYEQVIRFLETHDGQLMRSCFRKDGKQLNIDEMSEEERKEYKLYRRWYYSEERKILNEYEGRPIEEVLEEYREKIETLRKYGLGLTKNTVYEEVIEFLKTHNGQLMRSTIKREGKVERKRRNVRGRKRRKKFIFKVA